jgi:hypothetical protein
MKVCTAADFLHSFTEVYRESLSCFSRLRWEEIWKDSTLWNSFMLWKSSPSKPPELPKSAVASTALRLGLDYWEREPFRLHGVFYPRGTVVEHNFPFPILVARTNTTYLVMLRQRMLLSQICHGIGHVCHRVVVY